MADSIKYHDERQLYKDYQWVWDLISNPDEYRNLSDYVIHKIREYQNYETKTLLHLGCGSGCMDFHLKRKFQVTGVDLSREMISAAKSKNPECEYLTGDMRDFRNDKKFDAVIIPDSIDYMMSVEDISKVYKNAKQLLKDNGLFAVIVGYDPEKFPQNRTTAHEVTDNRRLVTFIENNYVPDYTKNYFEAIFIFLIREKEKLETIIDHHTLGLFKKEIWFNEMAKAGFKTKLIEDPYLEEIEQEGTYMLTGAK